MEDIQMKDREHRQQLNEKEEMQKELHNQMEKLLLDRSKDRF